jgi:hypothetical protein
VLKGLNAAYSYMFFRLLRLCNAQSSADQRFQT